MTNNKFGSKCKVCRRKNFALQKREVYDPIAERKRYLLRAKRGEFKGKWRHYRDKYPEKFSARRRLRDAVKAGKIKRLPCEVARECEGRIEAHHDDYSKPFDVRWLCLKHHKEHHHKHLSTLKELN